MNEDSRLRIKTAQMCRMLSLQGSIGMFGHVSIRAAGTDRVFISPGAGSEKSLVRPEQVFVFDIDGNILENPGGEIPLEWRIHTRIHRDRPDAMCIAHLHAHHATLVGIAGRDIVPVFLHGGFLHEGVPVWNNPRLVVKDEQAASLSATLAEKSAVQMRGHGSVVVGQSAEEAFFKCTFLEENARNQLEAEMLGGAVPLKADEAQDCAKGTLNPRLFGLLWEYFKNKADRAVGAGEILGREDRPGL